MAARSVLLAGLRNMEFLVPSKEFKLTIPRPDFLKIVSLLDEFGKLAQAKGIKFNKYTEEQLLEVLYMYRNYKTGDKPPF
jgi:hypothetical protein